MRRGRTSRSPDRSTTSALDQNVLHFAAIGAAVHAHEAADRSGNASQEFEASDAGVARRRGDEDAASRRRRSAALSRRNCSTFANCLAQPHHDARHAAVAHDQVGAEPQRHHRHVGSGAPRGRRADRRRPRGSNSHSAEPPLLNQTSGASGAPPSACRAHRSGRGQRRVHLHPPASTTASTPRGSGLGRRPASCIAAASAPASSICFGGVQLRCARVRISRCMSTAVEDPVAPAPSAIAADRRRRGPLPIW